ncbi:hypothetical protein BLNAU_3702 [Blattamonas nauphoetae]|uniref:Uncharacterized protein n=1 Tax=Blattamonas nauphoetae TaxID=2049346 RepID=A0ABQ9YBW3_9EUKA|nr:hypothetical protein BLNAU_3702 [Blattamonas nauphoetae]
MTKEDQDIFDLHLFSSNRYSGGDESDDDVVLKFDQDLPIYSDGEQYHDSIDQHSFKREQEDLIDHHDASRHSTGILSRTLESSLGYDDQIGEMNDDESTPVPQMYTATERQNIEELLTSKGKNTDKVPMTLGQGRAQQSTSLSELLSEEQEEYSYNHEKNDTEGNGIDKEDEQPDRRSPSPSSNRSTPHSLVSQSLSETDQNITAFEDIVAANERIDTLTSQCINMEQDISRLTSTRDAMEKEIARLDNQVLLLKGETIDVLVSEQQDPLFDNTGQGMDSDQTILPHREFGLWSEARRLVAKRTGKEKTEATQLSSLFWKGGKDHPEREVEWRMESALIECMRQSGGDEAQGVPQLTASVPLPRHIRRHSDYPSKTVSASVGEMPVDITFFDAEDEDHPQKEDTVQDDEGSHADRDSAHPLSAATPTSSQNEDSIPSKTHRTIIRNLERVYREENNRLTSVLSRLGEQNEELIMEVAMKSKTIDVLQKAVENKERHESIESVPQVQSPTIQTPEDWLRSETGLSLSEVKNLSKELASARLRNVNLIAQHKKETEDWSQTEMQLKEDEMRVRIQQEQSEEEIAQLQSSLLQAQREKEQLTKDVSTLHTQLQLKAKESEQLQKVNSNMTIERENLARQAAQTQKKVTDLKDQIASSEAEADQLRQDRKQLLTQCESLKTENQTLQRKTADLNKSLSAAESENRSLLKKLDKKEEERQEVVDDIRRQHETELGELTAKLKTLESQFDPEEKERWRQDNEAARDEIEQWKRRVILKENEWRRAEQRIADDINGILLVNNLLDLNSRSVPDLSSRSDKDSTQQALNRISGAIQTLLSQRSAISSEFENEKRKRLEEQQKGEGSRRKCREAEEKLLQAQELIQQLEDRLLDAEQEVKRAERIVLNNEREASDTKKRKDRTAAFSVAQVNQIQQEMRSIAALFKSETPRRTVNSTNSSIVSTSSSTSDLDPQSTLLRDSTLSTRNEEAESIEDHLGLLLSQTHNLRRILVHFLSSHELAKEDHKREVSRLEKFIRNLQQTEEEQKSIARDLHETVERIEAEREVFKGVQAKREQEMSLREKDVKKREDRNRVEQEQLEEKRQKVKEKRATIRQREMELELAEKEMMEARERDKAVEKKAEVALEQEKKEKKQIADTLHQLKLQLLSTNSDLQQARDENERVKQEHSTLVREMRESLEQEKEHSSRIQAMVQTEADRRERIAEDLSAKADELDQTKAELQRIVDKMTQQEQTIAELKRTLLDEQEKRNVEKEKWDRGEVARANERLTLEEERRIIHSENEQVRRENGLLRENCEHLGMELKAAEVKLREYQVGLSSAEDQLRTLSEQFEAVRARSSEGDRWVSQCQAELADVCLSLNRVTERLDWSREEHEKQIQLFEQSEREKTIWRDIVEHLVHVDQALGEMNECVVTLGISPEDTQTRITEYHHSLDQLTAHIEEHIGHITNGVQQLSPRDDPPGYSMSVLVERLTGIHDHLVRIRDTLADQDSARWSQGIALKREKLEAQRTIQELERKLKRTEKEIGALTTRTQQEIQRVAAEQAALEKSVSEKEEEVTTVIKECTALRREKEDILNDNQSLKQRIAELERNEELILDSFRANQIRARSTHGVSPQPSRLRSTGPVSSGARSTPLSQPLPPSNPSSTPKSVRFTPPRSSFVTHTPLNEQGLSPSQYLRTALPPQASSGITNDSTRNPHLPITPHPINPKRFSLTDVPVKFSPDTITFAIGNRDVNT